MPTCNFRYQPFVSVFQVTTTHGSNTYRLRLLIELQTARITITSVQPIAIKLSFRIHHTNLDGILFVSQATIRALKETKGAIVNIGSISGLRASTLRVAYGTSKAAVIHMTKQQAAELGEYGIRANCVCPGPVKTKLAMAVHSPEIISAYLDAMPLGRYGTENEIAEVIHFLCSDKASFVTGQIVAADGGFETTGVGLPALRAEK